MIDFVHGLHRTRNTVLTNHNGRDSSRRLPPRSRAPPLLLHWAAGCVDVVFVSRVATSGRVGAWHSCTRIDFLSFSQIFFPVLFLLLTPFFLLRVVSFPPPIVPVGSLSFTLLHKKL